MEWSELCDVGSQLALEAQLMQLCFSYAVREDVGSSAGSKQTGTRLTGTRLMQPAGPGANAAGRCNAIHKVQPDINIFIGSTAFQAQSPAMSNAFCQAGAMLLLPMQGDFLKWTKRKLPVQL